VCVCVCMCARAHTCTNPNHVGSYNMRERVRIRDAMIYFLEQQALN